MRRPTALDRPPRVDGRPSPLRRRQLEHGSPDAGMTLVELIVAFATLMVLFTVVAVTLSGYLTISNQVIGSYNTNDQILPTSIIIQRMLRSQVEPAPTPTASNQVTSPMCPVLNAPCPPFSLGNVSTTSVTFYANVGSEVVNGTTYGPGPALITMSATTPTKCATCRYYTSTFTVTERAPNKNSCPFSAASTLHCTYTTAPLVTLVSLSGVVNGQANLLNPATPIFTYNTLDPYSATYTPNVATSNFAVADCNPPTVTTINGVPTDTASNCAADTIQSVGVDLQVLQQGTQKESYQENAFVVYRLSSASYLYSTVVG